MRTALSIIALGGVALAASATTVRPSQDDVAHAGALFRKNCVTCHQPPDTTFATDRAWLGQVADTA